MGWHNTAAFVGKDSRGDIDRVWDIIKIRLEYMQYFGITHKT